MTKTVIRALLEFLPELVKTITCARETAFTNWEEIELCPTMVSWQ